MHDSFYTFTQIHSGFVESSAETNHCWRYQVWQWLAKIHFPITFIGSFLGDSVVSLRGRFRHHIHAIVHVYSPLSRILLFLRLWFFCKLQIALMHKCPKALMVFGRKTNLVNMECDILYLFFVSQSFTCVRNHWKTIFTGGRDEMDLRSSFSDGGTQLFPQSGYINLPKYWNLSWCAQFRYIECHSVYPKNACVSTIRVCQASGIPELCVICKIEVYLGSHDTPLKCMFIIRVYWRKKQSGYAEVAKYQKYTKLTLSRYIYMA